MSAKTDDLKAVRVLSDTLRPFSGEDRERIIRWVREKLGMVPVAGAPSAITMPDVAPTATEVKTAVAPAVIAGGVDIKRFVGDKAPKSDVHFAATVAYYHQFVAPTGQRKDSITKEDIVEACRQVDRKRPKVPAQVMVNAYQDGLFDRGGKGHYKLNSVGENLVAMALPGRPEAARAKGNKTARSVAKRGKGKGPAQGRRKARR
jgi:hypothetical protein